MEKIFITGATGNVGNELIKQLLKKNVSITAGVTSPQKAVKRLPKEITVREFNFINQNTYATALEGQEKVFVMRPPHMANAKKEFLPFLEYLKDKGIKHIVFLSLLGAEKNPIVPHRKIEDYIKRLSLPYTFLRPSFFMQNFNTTHCDEIKNENQLFIPAGKGKTSFIDVRDIAAVGAKVLTEAGHIGKAYSLTGDKALDYYEVEDIFTNVLKRKITYTNPSIVSFVRKNMKKRVLFSFIMVMVGIYTTAKLGIAKKVTQDFNTLMHRKTITFKQYVEDYKSYWLK